MLVTQPRSLLQRLTPFCSQLLERAAAACVSQGHDEVTVEHFVLVALESNGSDFQVVLNHYGANGESLLASVRQALRTFRSGAVGRPVFSRLLLEWIQDSWVYASVENRSTELRSGALLARLANQPERYCALDLAELNRLHPEELSRDVDVICATSVEAPRASSSSEGAGSSKRQSADGEGPLDKFTLDLTERARSGELDPVLGREKEVRQVVEILLRRRKNNPIIVGEPGVGKTALVEGLANRIAEGTVPAALANSRVLSLDLGALQAGAGVKGEFENRLKGVIEAVKASEQPIILFIDEAHTLIGAGGAQGGSDAANLLKPALARGELRTVAATTYAEFKKYFEKDAALERRFQPVRVEEPSLEVAELMIRGIAERFRVAHGVHIRDDAVRAAVTLSARYISGRQLPDKAVDLLDTSAAYVKLVQNAPPAILEDAQARLVGVQRELAALDADVAQGHHVEAELVSEAKESQTRLENEVQLYESQVAAQRALLKKLEEARAKDEPSTVEIQEILREIDEIPHEERLLHADVDESVVASIVADWTGIPIGKMVQDDLRTTLELEKRLEKRVRGQSPALAVLGRELRAARSGLKDPQAPMGVFLLVGPSGVGKTETALALADLMFGGERFTTVINMSEFQERHSVSRLIGSPPGYVGYGEGGLLTEAVRHRPYSVVLLDEIEKADPEVMNLFYQVFDKGTLSDGEGRVVDFSNTVVIMTSNLATDLLTNAASPDREMPSHEKLVDLVKPTLSNYLKPALLARMTVVPYVPIRREALIEITRMKLNTALKRAADSHKLQVDVHESVIGAIVDRCSEVESGARNVDHILRRTLLPRLSFAILESLAEGREMSHLRVAVGDDGEITCLISNKAP